MDQAADVNPNPLVEAIIVFERHLFRLCSEERQREQAANGEDAACTELQNLWHSLKHRARALPWHVDLLVNVHSVFVRMASADPEAAFKAAGNLLLRVDAAEAELFALEDLIFNTVTLFDYVGQLYFQISEPGRQDGRKWANLVGSCNATGKGGQGPPVAKVLIDVVQVANNAWLQGLAEVRGVLVHKHAARPLSEQALNLDTLKATVKVSLLVDDALRPFAPTGVARMVELEDGTTATVADVLDLAPNIALEALSTAAKVLETMSVARRAAAPVPYTSTWRAVFE